MGTINFIMTVAIYIRVSTQEQAKEGYSIPAQKERLIAYCVAQGWTNYKFYIDEGVSAKDTNRPELNRLLADAQSGKVNAVLVYRLDRFTRRVKDLYNLLDNLKKYNCAFISATEQYNTSSAMGKMFMGLVALLAEWETENLSERVKMALEEKVAGGERVGGIPYGFDLSEDEKLVKNEKATAVLDMIKKLKSGMSVNAIATNLNKTNSDKSDWKANTVFRILKNPALYGATRWNDKVYENTHEGLLTKAEFEKLQLILEDRGQHRRREVESTYIFQGVLFCPLCNNLLSVNRHVRKRKDGSEYQGACYKCQVCYKEGRKMISIGEHRFLEALMGYMKNVEFKDVQPVVEKENERGILVKQLQKIEKKREKYQRAWASDKMTDKEFDKLMDETKSAYDELKKKIEVFKAPVNVDVKELKNIVFTFNENFTHLTKEEQRMFISQFIRRIEFDLIPQPPKNHRNKKGKELVVINDVAFY
jgi:DNA invertase Pin-like site-specific DNA recombinase